MYLLLEKIKNLKFIKIKVNILITINLNKSEKHNLMFFTFKSIKLKGENLL